MQTTTTRPLVRLGESDRKLAKLDEDIRHRKIVDSNRDEIGKVDDLFVDPQTGQVRFLLAGQGGLLGIGKKQFLIPVDAIRRLEKDRVTLNATARRMEDAPQYDANVGEPDWEAVYLFWGFQPYWMTGYNYPDYPSYGQRSS